MNAWIPRNLRDDGMIPMNESPSYASFVKQYVLRSDHEQALDEKEREIQQIREHEFQRGYRDGEAAAKDALAEKDRLHGCQIAELCERLNDDYRAVLIGHEKAYKQLMAQAVRFAETVVKIHDFYGIESSDVESSMFLHSSEVQAWKEQQK